MDKPSCFAAGNDNTNGNPNNTIFNTKDIKLHVPVITLSAKVNQKLLKLLSIRSERSLCWNKYQTKNENKNKANEYRYVLNQTLLELIDSLFELRWQF